MASTGYVYRGLYYPYIHVPDDRIGWLKAAILIFGGLRRILPMNFSPHDSGAVLELAAPTWDSGPLLTSADLWSDQCKDTERGLATAMRSAKQDLIRRYGKEASEKSGAGITQINVGKLEPDLGSALVDCGLAWHTEGYTPDWLTMHQGMGEAVMATLALGISQGSGVEIVTPAHRIHEVFTRVEYKRLFEDLVGLEVDPPSVSPDEVAQMVISLEFLELEKISASQLHTILKEEDSLARFRDGLARRLYQVPRSVGSAAARKKLVSDIALEVLEDWRKSQSPLKKLLIPGAAAGSLAESLYKLHAGTGPELFEAAGGVVLSSWSIGKALIREYKESPYRYLNVIEKGARGSLASLVLPPWSSLAG